MHLCFNIPGFMDHTYSLGQVNMTESDVVPCDENENFFLMSAGRSAYRRLGSVGCGTVGIVGFLFNFYDSSPKSSRS